MLYKNHSVRISGSKKDIQFIIDSQARKKSDVLHTIWDDAAFDCYLGEIETGPTNTTALIFKFPLARKTLYYIMNTIIPCEILNIIMMIAFFTPFTNQMALSQYIVLRHI